MVGKGGHQHSMTKMDGKNHQCSSCEFRCTPSALPLVLRNTNLHRIVKVKPGMKPKVWNGEGVSRR
jgi:hypothetical protein